MEMETEDDVAVEGNMHVSFTGSATIVSNDDPQLTVDDNVEMALPDEELAVPP